MNYTYDAEVDALAIRLIPEAEIAKTLEIDESRHVDLDSEGRVVLIEILWASEGIEVDDLIERFNLDQFKGFLRDVANTDFRPAIAL